ncbi:MAG: GMP synthase (glutamine-hydrolyzing), partial [Thermoprotei archaeon]
LKGVTDPEEKRMIISRIYFKILDETSSKLASIYGDFEYLGQGTIYPDRVESGATSTVTARIKSHHNVVLAHLSRLRKLEPLKDLYKDEVRRLATSLGLPKELTERHPFPGPGLAIRIIGEVTEDKLRIVRRAHKIVEEEVKRHGLYTDLWQAFPVLLPVKTVGVMGDERTYRYAIAVRMVVSDDAMTAEFAKPPWKLLEDISTRIVNEIPEVNRVLYDITNKPPSTIEYE